MTSFATYLQARNAARKEFGKDFTSLVTLRKEVAGTWTYDLIEQPKQEEAAPTAAEWDAMVKKQEEEAAQQATTAQVAGVSASQGGKVWIKASSIPKPTKQVWFIADEMIAKNPQVTRKEVQEECVRRGIASGTARTQYQAWLTARKNDQANAEKAQAASDRINGKGI